MVLLSSCCGPSSRGQRQRGRWPHCTKITKHVQSFQNSTPPHCHLFYLFFSPFIVIAHRRQRHRHCRCRCHSHCGPTLPSTVHDAFSNTPLPRLHLQKRTTLLPSLSNTRPFTAPARPSKTQPANSTSNYATHLSRHTPCAGPPPALHRV